MKQSHEERKALRLKFCERCATVENAALNFAECAKDCLFENILRAGLRPQ